MLIYIWQVARETSSKYQDLCVEVQRFPASTKEHMLWACCKDFSPFTLDMILGHYRDV